MIGGHQECCDLLPGERMSRCGLLLGANAGKHCGPLVGKAVIGSTTLFHETSLSSSDVQELKISLAVGILAAAGRRRVVIF